MMEVCRESDRDYSACRAASVSLAASIAGRYFLVELTRAVLSRWMERVASEDGQARRRGVGGSASAIGGSKLTLTALVARHSIFQSRYEPEGS